jgi:hypothetical protein
MGAFSAGEADPDFFVVSRLICGAMPPLPTSTPPRANCANCANCAVRLVRIHLRHRYKVVAFRLTVTDPPRTKLERLCYKPESHGFDFR